MDGSRLRLATVVLAAGAGTRFAAGPGAKLLAELDGMPVLEHVLEAVRASGPVATIVVLGHGGAAIEQGTRWLDEVRVINHEPERGLSSSLQLGIDTLRAMAEPFDGAFIVLGDQPRLRTETLRRLAAAAARGRPADRPALVPRYSSGGARNPVLLLRPAWSWVDELAGDRGLGALLDGRSDQVLTVPIEGDMPDVDTPEDLARLAAGDELEAGGELAAGGKAVDPEGLAR